MLNEKHREAYVALRPGDAAATKDKRLTPKSDEEAVRLRAFMCDNFYDIRTFGGVLSTGVNAGQVRGLVQISFAQSVEPVPPLEISITRMAATNEAEKKTRAERDDSPEKRGDNRTMGRKHIIPYGLYRAYGFVSAPLAHDKRKGTGFTDADLALLFDALRDMFEHDRSAARGEMTTRRLVVFRHASALGNVRAQDLFSRVTTYRNHHGSILPISADALDNAPPARSFDDYTIQLDTAGLPDAIGMLDMT